jgi:hypothetical protein
MRRHVVGSAMAMCWLRKLLFLCFLGECRCDILLRCVESLEVLLYSFSAGSISRVRRRAGTMRGNCECRKERWQVERWGVWDCKGEAARVLLFHHRANEEDNQNRRE